jgi:predicted metal-dependent hydrolase
VGLKYLAGYSPAVVEKVQALIDNDQLAVYLQKKYPQAHQVKTDKALYEFVLAMKNRYLRQSSPLSKVIYDDRLDVLHQALGLHSFVSRVQGGKLKAKNEIRIGGVFRTAPIEFLQMIVAHELAHLREKERFISFVYISSRIITSWSLICVCI